MIRTWHVSVWISSFLLTLCNFSAEEEIDGGNYFNRLESYIYPSKNQRGLSLYDLSWFGIEY